MKMKVCGMRDNENIKSVAALLPDYMGFIFYGLSPRFAGSLQSDILQGLPSSINKTAVFVNENAEKINALIDQYQFNAVQLHGTESPEFSNSLRPRVKVLKAFGVDNDFDFEQLKLYINKVDFFLFDTKTDIYGGSGKSFDWSVLDRYQLDIPFFLSGGLSMDNLEEVKKITHPQFYGVDLNSRFETAPGIKNIEILKRAFSMLNQKSNEIRS